MDEINEGVGDPFDAPIPGQSLTDTPGNYPWEHPPQYTDPAEAAEFIWQSLHQDQFMEQTIGMLDAGVPVEAIARVLLFGGFMEGKFSPDVAFIIAEPVMKMIATMGLTAGVEKISMSMSDITNNEQIQSIVRTKVNAEETAQAAKGVKQDIKKIEKKGLMAKPNKEEMQ